MKNWVNSSLQLAGSLLESVDQQAALTLSGEADEENDGLLSSLTKGVTDAVKGKKPVEEDDEEQEHEMVNTNLKAPQPDDPFHAESTPTSPSSPTTSTPKPTSTSSQKETSRLKSELKAKEKLLAQSQQQVKIYEEEIEALEQECKDRIAQGQQEVLRLKEEKEVDERNFLHAMELKETQVAQLQQEVARLQSDANQQAERMEQLQKELTDATASKEQLWSSAASASNESEQLIASLRAELQDTMTAMTTLKREYGDAKLAMFTRQSQLEKTNAELMNNVADLEKEVAKMKEAAASAAASSTSVASSSTTASTQPTDEYNRKLQQNLVLLKKSLHDETRTNEIQKQEIAQLTDQVKRLQDQMEAAQATSTKRLMALTEENESLKQQLQQHQSTGGTAERNPESEARIHTLTNRLLEKQETIDALRTKLTTMDVRLNDAQSRSRIAEEKLAQMERNGGLMDDDMEMATPVGKRSGHARIRSRNRMANAITRVAPVVERSTRVVSALDALDRWLLFLGRIFLSYPFARLGMVCYVALIHCWVFVVLSFHTSHLNEEIEQDHRHHESNPGLLMPDTNE